MCLIKGGKDRQDVCTPRSPQGIRGQGACSSMVNNGLAGGNMSGPCPVSPCIMVQPPDNGMGASPCPFTPCILDEYRQSKADPYGRPPANPPCQECGGVHNAPCIQPQGGGMMMGAGIPMGGFNSPCQECGMVPNAACIQPQGGGMMMGAGMPMGGFNTPCQECGAMPNAPCIPQGGGMMMGAGMPMGGFNSPCQECRTVPNAPCMPQGGGMMMGAGMAMGGAMSPCIECGNIPNAPCIPQGNTCTPQGNTCTQPANTPCSECAGLKNPPCAVPLEPEGNYQEIGASMGGNSLTIRVHKDKNKIEQIDPNGNISDNNSEEVCCCSPRQKRNKKTNQGQTFNMRPGMHQDNQDTPFSFKMGKSGNTGNNVVVNPPVATAPDGTKFTEFSDPNKELFILRVGKKNEGIDRKQNLELELCTPRGKVL